MNNPEPKSTSQLFLSLVRDTLPHTYHSAKQTLNHHSTQSHCALWLQSGAIEINDKTITSGHGLNFTNSDTIAVTGTQPAMILRFIVSKNAIEALDLSVPNQNPSETIFTQAINITSPELIFRLDQVDFPPAAIAYKHTHPGPGIRYLVEGGLTLISDHGEQTVGVGDAWFEDADSPVQANADSSVPSRFVRAMLLPMEYEGRSTFTLCDENDASKPKLQNNIRHFEKRMLIDDTH